MAKKSARNGSSEPDMQLSTQVPMQIDAAWLLRLHREALARIGSIVTSIRTQLIDNKHDRAIHNALGDAYELLSRGVAEAIHMNVATPITDQSQVSSLCDDMRRTITKAKSHLGYNITRPLRKVIESEFDNATRQVSSAIESLAQHSAKVISPVSSIVNFDTSGNSEKKTYEKLPLSFLLTNNEALQTPEQQQGFVQEKLRSTLVPVFMNFIDSLRHEPFQYAHTLTQPEARMFMKIFNETAVVLDECCAADKMTINDLRGAVKSRLVPEMFQGTLLKMSTAIQDEFHKAVTGPLACIFDGLETDEDLYLFLSMGIPQGTSITSEMDLVVLLQWETIENGADASIRPEEEVLLRSALPCRPGDLRKVRVSDQALTKAVNRLNQFCHGGYPLREKEFVINVINYWIENNGSMISQPAGEIPLSTETQPDDHSIVVAPDASKAESLSLSQVDEVVPPVSTEVQIDSDIAIFDVAAAPPPQPVSDGDPVVGNDDVDFFVFPDTEIACARRILERMKVKSAEKINKFGRKSLWAQVCKELYPGGRHVSAQYQWAMIDAALKANETVTDDVPVTHACAAIDHTISTSREQELVQKMCRAELTNGEPIPDKKISMLLMSINIVRLRQGLPKRDETFVRALTEKIRGLFPVKPPQIPHDASSVAPVSFESPMNEIVHIETEPIIDPVVSNASPALTEILRQVAEELVPNRQQTDEEVPDVIPKEATDAKTEPVDEPDLEVEMFADNRDEQIWIQAMQFARLREELERERSELAEQRMQYELERFQLDVLREQLAKERTELSALRQKLEDSSMARKGIDILLQDWQQRNAALKAERESLNAERQALEEGQEALSSEREEFDADREALESERAELEELRAGARNGEGLGNEYGEPDAEDDEDEKNGVEGVAIDTLHQPPAKDCLPVIETMDDAKMKCADLRKKVVRCMNDIDHTRQSACDIFGIARRIMRQNGTELLTMNELMAGIMQEYAGRDPEGLLLECRNYRGHVRCLSGVIQELEIIALAWMKKSSKKKDKEIFDQSYALCEQARADASVFIEENSYTDYVFLVQLDEILKKVDGLSIL